MAQVDEFYWKIVFYEGNDMSHRRFQKLKKPLHWIISVLILEIGILVIGWLVSATPAPNLDEPAYGWWIVMSLIIGLIPFYCRKKARLYLGAVLMTVLMGIVGGLLTRFWEAETAGFVPLSMLFVLCAWSYNSSKI